MRGRLTVAASVHKQQAYLGLHRQSVRALGEDVFIVLCHAPLIRLWHLLPPEKPRGEKALDAKGVAEKSVNCGTWCLRLPTPDLLIDSTLRVSSQV